jgi:hypothetical protein
MMIGKPQEYRVLRGLEWCRMVERFVARRSMLLCAAARECVPGFHADSKTYVQIHRHPMPAVTATVV